MKLDDYNTRLQALAAELGLDYYPVDFELVPQNFMLEIAVYGVPVRMHHWSFGLRYIHQLLHQHMGHSRIFEVMFPGDPCRAYMMDRNSLAENTLVTAHVIGHADFVKRNALFTRFMSMAGGHILEQSAARAHNLEDALLRHGQQAVESVLDAALALEPHIDINQPLYRQPYAEPAIDAAAPDAFRQRFQALPGESRPAPAPPGRPKIPPHPEQDLLWFIARHAPELKDWERDIFLAVREEAFYFFPVHACQIMNEGWASYWHARLLREADFLPHDLYLQALRAHSDVVRPYGNEQQLALAINPYHLGFALWEDIIDREGIDAARRICAEEDDSGFIRHHLHAKLAEKLDLFSYQARSDGEARVVSRDIHDVHEAILGPKYNYGAPFIQVERMNDDFSLVLRHDHTRDGRGLDLAQAEQVMQYVVRVWRRPLTLHTVDFRGTPRTVQVTPPDSARTSARLV
ncbi:stage V sporulation protein R [Pseudoduganella sp. FT25W]|uniref:Stage V sporulation protein R n=1 Tax=Duganella alba TaxID=2666081 RepID=A0A6L5Q9I5_9BURK|nr:SpoVR family protein [Duganella alba]MRX06464.1 stage V sporulation protein R [Duganella alba]MRX14858.1 stage V sporulation protein R [Duganella alba]